MNKLSIAFALLFHLTVGGAFGQNSLSSNVGTLPWEFGFCNSPTALTNFSANFYTGTWYEQMSYGQNLFRAGGICPTLRCKLSAQGVIQELYSQFKQLLGNWVSLVGTGNTSTIQNGKGMVTMTYRFFAGNSSYEMGTVLRIRCIEDISLEKSRREMNVCISQKEHILRENIDSIKFECLCMKHRISETFVNIDLLH